MSDRSCTLETKIFNTFNNKTSSQTASSSHDALSRLQLIEAGKEILARGQKPSPADAELIRDVRKMLNVALPECGKLDEKSGKFDRELEQRVALFQERHLAPDPKLAGAKEIDGVVGKNTFATLKLVASAKATPAAQVKPGPVVTTDDPVTEMSEAEYKQEVEARARIDAQLEEVKRKLQSTK